FAGIAQFERDLTSERTKEGILAAKKRGKYPGRPSVDKDVNVKLSMYISACLSMYKINHFLC
ncbi:recombinase family protein, partial [Bacillus cereus]